MIIYLYLLLEGSQNGIVKLLKPGSPGNNNFYVYN